MQKPIPGFLTGILLETRSWLKNRKHRSIDRGVPPLMLQMGNTMRLSHTTMNPKTVAPTFRLEASCRVKWGTRTTVSRYAAMGYAERQVSRKRKVGRQGQHRHFAGNQCQPKHRARCRQFDLRHRILCRIVDRLKVVCVDDFHPDRLNLIFLLSYLP